MKILVLREDWDKNKLVQKRVKVSRNGKIFYRNQWVKKDKEEKAEIGLRDIGDFISDIFPFWKSDLMSEGRKLVKKLEKRLKSIKEPKYHDTERLKINCDNFSFQYKKGEIRYSELESVRVEYKQKLKENEDNELAYQRRVSNIVKKILRDKRHMGATQEQLNKQFGKSNSPVRAIVEEALSCYPTDWIEKSIARGQIKLFETKRKDELSYYREERNPLTGRLEGIIVLRSRFRLDSAIHELAHRIEKSVSGILDLEKEYYNMRTKGEIPKKLKDLYPDSKYSDDAVTRKDKFVRPYMGRDYGGSYYELVSMGFELLFTNPKELLEKDRDMANWIFGILATK